MKPVVGVDHGAAQGHAGFPGLAVMIGGMPATCLAAVEPDCRDHAVMRIDGNEAMLGGRSVAVRLHGLRPCLSAVERLRHHDVVGIRLGTGHLEPVRDPVIVAERRHRGQVCPVDEHVFARHDRLWRFPASVRQRGIPERRAGRVRFHPAQHQRPGGTGGQPRSFGVHAGRDEEGACDSIIRRFGRRTGAEQQQEDREGSWHRPIMQARRAKVPARQAVNWIRQIDSGQWACILRRLLLVW